MATMRGQASPAAPKAVPLRVIEQQVRAANTHDWPAIDRLLKLAHEHEGDIPYTSLPDIPHRIFVAECDAEVVGILVMFSPDADVSQISHLFIQREHREKGLASALVEMAISVNPKLGLLVKYCNVQASSCTKSWFCERRFYKHAARFMMILKLTPSQKNQIVCTANRLRINSRDQFYRAVNRILSSCPQLPISNNDVLRACDLVMQAIPTSEIMITRSIGATTGDEDEYYCRR